VVQLKAGLTDELSINIALLNRPINTTFIGKASGRSLLSITQKNAISHIGEQALNVKIPKFSTLKGFDYLRCRAMVSIRVIDFGLCLCLYNVG